MTLSSAPATIWQDLLERLKRDPGVAAFMRDDAAVLLFSADGSVVIHANPAGNTLSLAAIPPVTAKRLTSLAQGLAPKGGVRLERLEFVTTSGAQHMTAACRRIDDGKGGELLLVAIPQMAAHLPIHAPPVQTTLDLGPVVAGTAHAPDAPEPSPRVLPPKVRFLWELAPDGMIRKVSDEASEVFGPARVHAMVGQHWSALCGSVVHDPDGEVAAALAGEKTWSGKTSLWRTEGAGKALRVTLSGLPLTDQQRALTGWRGFGIVDTTVLHEFPEQHVAALAVPDVSPVNASKPEPAPTVADLPVAESTPLPAEPPQPPASNVVAIRPQDPTPRLTTSERNAFREIAKALGARVTGDPAPADEVATAPEPLHVSLPATLPEPPAPVAEQSVAPAHEPVAELVAERAAPEAISTVHRLVTVVPPQAPRDDMFASLLDKLPIGVLVLKAERMVYANRTLLDLLDHDSLDDLLDVGTGRLFRGGAPSEGGGVFSLMRRDGSFEPVDARLSAIAWNGEAATLMSFRRALEQVDAQRLEAMKLDVAKARGETRELSAILDTATDGVATLDERGRILSLNKSAEALFGYDQREVAGENFTLLLAPESHITALDYLEGLKGGGVAALLNDGREVSGRVRQGGRIPLSMTMGRVADEPERKFSVVLRDMTAWKRAEADLVDAKKLAEQASAQKSDVLAKISHEIRTPLNAIIGFTEVMSEERFGPIGNERYKEYLGDIHQSGAYLISLINDLLDLAKIEAGKMDLTFTSVNLNEIAGAAVALLQPEANRQRVVLRTGLQPKLPSVVADERSLRQIVINVLSNAVKFTDAGGQVILSTALGDRGEVIIRVRDTGIGMTEKELSLAMEPFRQISATRRATSSGTGGTGLGLPITKALVEANKGALQITSVKNEGTLVEVMFPPQRVLAS
ncbi:MAG: ATP-binding protein [Bosea sp. (in: a-proteobacteria)]